MIYTLSQICNMQSGGTPRRGSSEFYGGDIPWIKISDFKDSSGGIITETDETITKEGLQSINNRLFEKGTLLLAMYGSVGKTAFTGVQASCNQAILGITAKDDNQLNLKFLKYWFDLNQGSLVHQGRGVTLNNISLTIVKKQKIDLPDLETQNKIVAILDKASALVQKSEKVIDEIEKIEKEYFKTVFGDTYINPKGFPLEKIVQLAKNIVDCPHSTPKYVDEITEYPCIRTSEIRNGRIYWDSMKYLTKKGYEKRIERYKPIEGDIIFAREGTVGDAAIIPKDLKVSLGQRVMLFSLDTDKVIPIFFWALLRSDGIQHKIKSKIIGATVSRINISEVKKIECPIPPITLQKEFKEKFQSILNLKQKKADSLAASKTLEMSILQRAFSGKLDLNVSVELDALLEEIDLQKPENDLFSIITNEEYLLSLVNRLNNQEFESQDLYDKAKHIAFQLLKDEERLAQEYDEKTQSLKLVVK